MRKKSYKAFICIVSLLFSLIILYAVIAQEEDCVKSVKFVVNSDEGTKEKIALFKNIDKYYAFLPAYAKLETLGIEYMPGCQLYIDGNKYDSHSSCANLKIEKNYSLEIKNSLGVTVLDESLIILQSSKVSTLSLHITNGSIEELYKSKEVKKSGTCTMIYAEGKINYQGTFEEISGRGGYTWTQEKKPYNISFKSEVDLLNLGEANNWVLLSNPLDQSCLRNKIVYDAAKKFGLTYSVDSEFVDLYINDVYQGLYLLTEKVEIDSNRVDIENLFQNTQNLNNAELKTYESIEDDKGLMYKKYFDIPTNPSDITGGYLLELQHWDSRYTFKSVFTTKSKNCFSFKSSPYVSKEQMDYIRSYIQSVEDSIENEKYENYIDINSWVKYYLIQEVFGNMDTRSFFYYKDSEKVDNKLYAGPVWDFDTSLGNHCFGDEVNPYAFYVNTWGWYSSLYKDDQFKKQVVSTYFSEMIPLLNNIINNELYNYNHKIVDAYKMNKCRWEDIEYTNRTDGYDELDEHLSWISTYLSERMTFLEDIWLNEKDICSITAISKVTDIDYSHKYYYTVEKGGTLSNLPVLKDEGYTFEGWRDVETQQIYTSEIVITSNKTYEAVWRKNNSEINEFFEESVEEKIIRIINNNISLLVGLFIFGIIIITVMLCIGKDFNERKDDR